MKHILPVLTEALRALWDVIAATFETLILGKRPEQQDAP